MNEKTEPEKLLDTARLLFEVSGKLSEFQILNLKNAPLFLFGNELSNNVEIDFDSKSVCFDLKGKPDFLEENEKDFCENLVFFTKKLLGYGINVNLTINERKLVDRNIYEPKEIRKLKFKPQGKGVLRKVRKRK